MSWIDGRIVVLPFCFAGWLTAAWFLRGEKKYLKKIEIPKFHYLTNFDDILEANGL